MNKKPITSLTEYFRVPVQNCIRCGKNHRSVAFHAFINPHPTDTFTHWGTCPYTDDPLFLKMPLPTEPWPDGMRIYGKRGTKFAEKYGVVVGRRRCQLEGCSGLQLCVRWADNKRTWCCTKGLVNHSMGMQIP